MFGNFKLFLEKGLRSETYMDTAYEVSISECLQILGENVIFLKTKCHILNAVCVFWKSGLLLPSGIGRHVIWLTYRKDYSVTWLYSIYICMTGLYVTTLPHHHKTQGSVILM